MAVHTVTKKLSRQTNSKLFKAFHSFSKTIQGHFQFSEIQRLFKDFSRLALNSRPVQEPCKQQPRLSSKVLDITWQTEVRFPQALSESLVVTGREDYLDKVSEHGLTSPSTHYRSFWRRHRA